MSSLSDIKLIRTDFFFFFFNNLILAQRPRSDAITCSQQREWCQSPGREIWWSDYNPSQVGNLQSQPESEAGAHNECLLLQWTDGRQQPQERALHRICVDGKREIHMLVAPTSFPLSPYNANYLSTTTPQEKKPILVRSPKLTHVGWG